MKQLKYRLYGLYFIIVAVFILLLYFLLANVTEDRIVSEQQENLNDKIVSVTDYVEAEATELTSEGAATQTLANISSIVEERMLLLNTEGELIYDSTLPVSDSDHPFNTVELQQTLDGETISLRTDNENNQYYVAQGIYNQNNEPVGILSLSSEVTDLSGTIQMTLRIFMIGMIIMALIVIFFSNRWLDRITESINEMKRSMKRLTNHDYSARYTRQSYDDIDELGTSMNELALNLKEQEQELVASQEQTYGLINHLVIGFLLLDEERRIQMVNPVVNELLGTNLYGKISHLYTDYVKSAELIELIETAYSKNETVNEEIGIYFPEEKTVDANVVPVPSQTPDETNYIVLLYDITEIRRLESMRTDFAANVSHELRTPITALKGFSETLLDGAMHDEEVLTEFLEIMLNESTRLDSMVQDILQLSQLERRRTRASTERLEVNAIVEEVFQILQQKIELKNMTCYIEEEENVSIRANRDYLKQILMNLIANAITYTPENGTVIVDIEEIEDEVKIQIIDNGIGIPEEDKMRIFERFYRVDKARSRNSGGTGLGLSIVKWVIDRMNGRIELFSEVNVGTTFVIWLPLEPDRDEKSD